jgi:sugar/nucleoside kinase (ribokinase family)
VAHIVVIGSVARDEIVNLASPLRAGAHLNGNRAGVRIGGGGANTAVALAAAGHRVTLLAAVGQDAIGDALLGELEQAGVDTAQIVRLDCASTHSLVLVDPQGERTIVNVARCDEMEPPTRLLALGADAIYVRSRRSDLAPLLARKAADALIVAHVPPLDAGSRPAHILVASASDLEREVAVAPLALARAVAGDGLRWVVVTADAAGARATSDSEVLDAPAPAVAVVDTTGAGDAFAAGLLHALLSEAPMRDALALAVRFGSEATRWPRSGLPAEAVHQLLQ